MTEIVLKDTLNGHWKNDKSAFGYRMLMKMGWSADKGLGKMEDGIVNSVKIKKRDDGLGLGMEAGKDDQVGSKSWNETVSGFNAVLNLLKTAKYQNHAHETPSSDVDSDSGEKKMKSKKQRKEKKQKKEKKDKKSQPIFSVGIK
jgi:Pin2-interacting protein X1